MNRTFNIINQKDDNSDKSYWMNVSPIKRLEALEELRNQYVRIKGIEPKVHIVCKIVNIS